MTSRTNHTNPPCLLRVVLERHSVSISKGVHDIPRTMDDPHFAWGLRRGAVGLARPTKGVTLLYATSANGGTMIVILPKELAMRWITARMHTKSHDVHDTICRPSLWTRIDTSLRPLGVDLVIATVIAPVVVRENVRVTTVVPAAAGRNVVHPKAARMRREHPQPSADMAEHDIEYKYIRS